MPNKNYIAGRNLEYKTAKEWRDSGHLVLRTAGSHGPFDLVAVNNHRHNVTFIQCKRVETSSEAARLIRDFKKDPPIKPMIYSKFDQAIVIYIKSEKRTETVYV